MNGRVFGGSLCAAALSLAILSGCGGGDPPYTGAPRFPVSGKVTFDGEPVDGGTISFLPQGSDSNPAGGPIVAGAYSVPEEKGPNAETYSVVINWQKPTGKQRQDSDTGKMVDITKEAIPAKYNSNTELTATVEVKPEGNVFDFDLKSK